MAPDRLLSEGWVVEYEGRLWLVGLVNDSRARLDPLTGSDVKIGKRAFIDFGRSVNISPGAMLKVVDKATLDETAIERFNRLTQEDTMTDEAGVSEVPVPATKKRVAKTAKTVTPKAAKMPKAAKVGAPKAEKVMSPCKCGCGDKTGGHFVPGHDARFKGWLLAIERGDKKLEELKKSVRESYKWVKRGDGWVPTTNYKGEPHKGYDA